MTNKELLTETVQSSGITITHLASVLGCSRNRIYSILSGADATASEIVGLSKALHLDTDKRDRIFLPESVSEVNIHND